jgi:uroporphyrinogen-III decarboxylase
MFLSVEDCTTIKEIKFRADRLRKQAEKEMQIYLTRFSENERLKAHECSKGEACDCLQRMVETYLLKHPMTDVDYHLMFRPCFETLQRVAGNYRFKSVEKPYFNKFFAKEWIKINYCSIVRKVCS